MTDISDEARLARVVALTQYLGISYVSEGWHSIRFPKMVKTAIEYINQKDLSLTGLKVWWHPRNPADLSVRVEKTFGDGTYLDETHGLCGIIGKPFLEDLEELARSKALEEIREEREQRLSRMAARRVARMMEKADLTASAPAAVSETLELF